MHTDIPNHEPALLMMNSGQIQPTRPSLGSWLTYGLGTENQNLPGFVVLCPGKPVVGPQLWSNSFLPGIYQGTHINNKSIDPKSDHRPRDQPDTSRKDAQRGQLDLLQRMNELHLADRAPATRSSRPGSSRWRWPSGCSSRRQDAFDIGRESAGDARACTARASSPTPA